MNRTIVNALIYLPLCWCCYDMQCALYSWLNMRLYIRCYESVSHIWILLQLLGYHSIQTISFHATVIVFVPFTSMKRLFTCTCEGLHNRVTTTTLIFYEPICWQSWTLHRQNRPIFRFFFSVVIHGCNRTV